jgi:hypothetical protein
VFDERLRRRRRRRRLRRRRRPLLVLSSRLARAAGIEALNADL